MLLLCARATEHSRRYRVQGLRELLKVLENHRLRSEIYCPRAFITTNATEDSKDWLTCESNE